MDLEATVEQLELQQTVRRCLADAVPVAEVRRFSSEGATWAPDRTWKRLADLGAVGLLAPHAAGGAGLGMAEAAMVAEECGRALYPGPWLASSVSAVQALDAVGADGLLAAVAAGRTIAAAVLPAPDLERRTPLRFSFDGERVTGDQPGVLGAPLADLLLVPATRGSVVELVAVDRAIANAPSIDPSTATGHVHLEAAPATPLGPISRDRLEQITTDLLVAWAADALGTAEAVLQLAVEHAKVRHQFGRPIGSFQAVQHLCVDMFETVELARGGVLHAAWAADAGAPAVRWLAALRVKSFADRLVTVADGAIQVLGGIGFTWEHDAHLHLRRLMSWAVAFGSASTYRIAVGRAVAAERGG